MTELEELKRSLVQAGLEAGHKIGELRDANARLEREAAENMEALRMAGQVQHVLRDERDRALAANTLLREERDRLRERASLAEARLLGIADGMEAWARTVRSFDSSVIEGVDFAAAIEAKARVIRAMVPAVTGTTSGQPALPPFEITDGPAEPEPQRPRAVGELAHAFVPAPFYPEACDAKVDDDDDGRVRTCGRPRGEHGR